jgi:putative transposon-encoded protein
MKKIPLKEKTRLTVTGVLGFFERKVTAFGNGAKVDCQKEFIGKRVYLIICKD